MSMFAWILISFSAVAGTPLTSTAPIELPGKAGSFDYMQVDSANHRLLASHKKAGKLTILDLKSGKLLPEVETGAAQGLAVDAKNHRYFVGDEAEKKVVSIDSNSISKLSEIKLDGPVDALTYDSKNGMIYADEDDGTKIWVIDPNAKSVSAVILAPGEPEFVEYGPVTNKIYQNIKTKNSVVVIDPDTNSIKSTWSTLPATSPHGLALDEKRNRLFSAGGNGKLVAIDFKTGKVTGTADIGSHVDQIAFDANKRIIYCAGKKVISAVRETDTGLEALGDVSSPEGAHTIAIDPENHDVWVSFADKDKSYLQRFKFSAPKEQ